MRRALIAGAAFLAISVSTVARAQAPTLVNQYGVVKKAAKLEDEQKKAFKLKKGEQVLVVYERGEWYWVQNKKKQQAWVLKNTVKLKKEPAKKGKEREEGQEAGKQDKNAKSKLKDMVPKVDELMKDKDEDSGLDDLDLGGEIDELEAPKPAPVAVLPVVAPAAEPIPSPTPPVVTSVPTVAPVVALTPPLEPTLPLAMLKKEGRLSIYASEEGARVTVDGKDVGKAPIRALPVKGGLHTVTVKREGFLTSTALVEIDGGEVPVALALRPTESTRDDVVGGYWLWRAIGLGGLGLGAAATYSGAALAAWGMVSRWDANAAINDFNQQSIQPSDEKAALEERRESAKTLEAVGQVTLLTGIVVTTAGAIATVLASGDPSRYDVYESGGQE